MGAAWHGEALGLACALLQGGAGAAFAAAVGAQAGLSEARRVLDVTRIPPGRIAGLRESAAPAAAGYNLVTREGKIPDEHLSGVAYVHEALNDTPWDFEAVHWDADRVREEINRRVRRSGGPATGTKASRRSTARPGMRMIQTGNPNDNTHMIAINEQLGYELPQPSWQFYTIDVAAIPTR